MKHDLTMKRIKQIVAEFDSKGLMILEGKKFSPNDKFQNKLFDEIKSTQQFNDAILTTIVKFFPFISKNDLLDYTCVILGHYQTILEKKGWTTDQLFDEIKND